MRHVLFLGTCGMWGFKKEQYKQHSIDNIVYYCSLNRCAPLNKKLTMQEIRMLEPPISKLHSITLILMQILPLPLLLLHAWMIHPLILPSWWMAQPILPDDGSSPDYTPNQYHSNPTQELTTNQINPSCLKIMSLNCCSLRSLSKRNQLGALLSNYDIDIVFGCESYIDQSFSSSEILPKNYKIIRKDRSLGGGGVFIGFKDHLNISEVSELAIEAEMIWARLSTPKQKPLYLCSLYRIPNNDSRPILSLIVSLQKLHQMVPSPGILLAGDLNLPSVTWSDGGIINSCMSNLRSWN